MCVSDTSIKPRTAKSRSQRGNATKELIMCSPGNPDLPQLVTESALYKQFVEEKEEILKHKWIESEKAGYDIGFDKALLDWIFKHRIAWRAARNASLPLAA